MTGAVDPSKIERIWIRCPNWLGDFVMATATFQRVRTAFPGARITAGMRPHLRPLANGSDYFDGIVDTPRGGGLRRLWREAREMRSCRFDLAIVLPNSPATGLTPLLAGVPLRLGYKQARPGLMNLGLYADTGRRWWQQRSRPARQLIPMPQYYHELLDVLGIPPGGMHPKLSVAEEDDAWIARYLEQRGVGREAPLLLLVVGASYGASKLWMPERFAAISRYFQDKHGMRALVLVGPGEAKLGERIAADGGAIAMTSPVLPLNALKALVRRGRLMITGDTGPRHLGNAFNLPVVCMIGPNDPRYTDYCMERTALIRKDLACSPCQRKICPLGHQSCMRDITVAEVAQAGERLLGLSG